MMTLENDILTKELTTSIKNQQVLALVITIRMTDMLFMIGHLFPHTHTHTHTSNACNFYICFSKMGHGVCLYSPMRSIMHQTSLLERRNAHWKVLHHVSYAR